MAADVAWGGIWHDSDVAYTWTNKMVTRGTYDFQHMAPIALWHVALPIYHTWHNWYSAHGTIRSLTHGILVCQHVAPLTLDTWHHWLLTCVTYDLGHVATYFDMLILRVFWHILFWRVTYFDMLILIMLKFLFILIKN